MSGISLRAATAEDAGAIAAVHIASWRVAYRGILSDDLLDGLTLEGRTEIWQARIASWEVTVAQDADRIVGLCELRRERDRPPLIHALYLDPEVLRAGIGTRLVRDTAKRLRAEGEREVTLNVVVGNDRARAFYDHLGFMPTGVSEQWHGATQVQLRLALTS